MIEQMLGLVEASTTLGVGKPRSRMVRKAERMGASAVVGARYAAVSAWHHDHLFVVPWNQRELAAETLTALSRKGR